MEKNKVKEIRIKSINIIQNEDVYDITVKKNHNFFANNLLIHNCGEIPLCGYDSCRLLSINLLSYVDEPFTLNAKFNFELFKEHVEYAQKMMDDIVDLELEKIDVILNKIEKDNDSEVLKQVEKELWLNIRQKAVEGRRTGLGITAEGDMLAALNIRYGTPEATDFSTLVHKTLAIYSYKASIDMAKERGCFPIWNENNEKESLFIQRILPELKTIGYEKLYKQFGRRNIANLTIAPTGCLVGNTIINTVNGDIPLEELFSINGINVEECKKINNTWFIPNHDFFVKDINGGEHKISKLYWNGYDKTKKILYSNNEMIESTLEHKFLVKINETQAVWKKTEDLKKGDKILKINSFSL